MVAEGGDDRLPLLEEVALRLGGHGVEAPARVFGPREVAEPVGPVVEAVLEDLLVQARAVEAHGHRALDVGLELRVRGRGPDAVRVEALVEHEAQEDGLAVEQDAVALARDLAHREVALDRVDLPAAALDGEREVVEEGVGGRPRAHVRDRERDGRALRGGDVALRDDLAAGAHDGAEAVARRDGEEARLEHDLARVEVRGRAARGEALRGDRLGPDRLPDAGDARVVAAGREEAVALLAVALQERAHVVVRVDDENLLCAGLRQIRDVERERRRAAVVRAGVPAVEPDLREEVNAAEAKEDPPAGPRLRERHLAAIPDVLHEVDVRDAGEFRLRAERHDDLAVEELLLLDDAALARGAGAVDAEVPGAVEVQPRAFAAELHAGILGAGNAGIVLFHVGGGGGAGKGGRRARRRGRRRRRA